YQLPPYCHSDPALCGKRISDQFQMCLTHGVNQRCFASLNMTAPYYLLCLLRRRKPAGDFKLASHHRRIVAINRQIDIIENDEWLRVLHVVKKMYQGRPWTLRFHGSENRLMIRGGLACSDRWIFNQNIILAGDFPELIEQSGGFGGIREYRLMLPDPIVAFRPDVALLHVESLLRQLAPAGRQLLLRAADCAQDPTYNPKIDQPDHRSGHNQREHTLTRLHSLVPRRDHFGFPSNRNCAWLLGKIRGAAISN